jgi:hypothetical protein
MTSKTFQIWIAMSENGDCEAATDEDTAIENLKNGSSEDLAGTACRVVKVNVTMSEPRYRDDDDETDKAFDVTIPDGVGRIVEVG